MQLPPHHTHAVPSLPLGRPVPCCQDTPNVARPLSPLLAETRTGFQAPLMGLIQRTPLRRHHPECPAPAETGPEVPPSNADRPCRFSRLRRVAPLRASRACCIPLPTMGFARFCACRPRPKPHTPDTPPSVDPSELFPPLRPSPVTPTSLPGLPKPEPLSPLPNASRSCRQACKNTRRPTRPQGFDPHRVRCLPQCCHHARPDALMGFLDFGLSPTLRSRPLYAARHRSDEPPAMQAPLLTRQPSRTTACATAP